MEDTIQALGELLKEELSRIEGQLMENDITSEEFKEIEALLMKIGKLIGVNIYS